MRIAILTSGGDAPGMNAAIRSLTKSGIARGHTMLGIRRGYEGLLEQDVVTLALEDVDGISRRGGTMLGSARCPHFATEAGQNEACAAVKAMKLDALVVIGGNGSLTGAYELGKRLPELRVMGLPASIDNDVGHSGLSIGVDTAVNTIVDACDRISDTAGSHRRAFIVEVMGRQCGYLAMRAGIAAEADAILYAERHVDEAVLTDRLALLLEQSFSGARQKRHVLIVKAEGVAVPTATLRARLQAVSDEAGLKVNVRETVLGHVVRGGSPSSTDRVIAQRLALAALLGLEDGATGQMAAWHAPGNAGTATRDSAVRLVPLADVMHETACMLDGTSQVTRARLALIEQVEGILAL